MPGWRGSTGLFLRQRGHHQSAPFTAQLIRITLLSHAGTPIDPPADQGHIQ